MLSSPLTDAEKYYSKNKEYGTVHPQRYSYSWSGADAKVFAFFSQREDLIRPLESVHTISVSVHEAKSQVRSLGHRGIRGLTRSSRTIAGSLILTVVNDHPLRSLMDMYNTMTLLDPSGEPYPSYVDARILGWSIDRDTIGVGTYQDIYNFQNRMSSLLPPFNLLIEFVSEASPVTEDASFLSQDIDTKSKLDYKKINRQLFPGAGLLLQDIELLDESFVVSVNDMVTEITCSYIARDYKPISAKTFSSGGLGAITNTEIFNRQLELQKKIFESNEVEANVHRLNGRLLPASPEWEQQQSNIKVDMSDYEWAGDELGWVKIK